MNKALALLSGLALAGCSVVGVRSGTEEPPYTVEARIGEVEIRTYGPRLAAETFVEDGEEAARNAGFKRLAGYIFGGNTAKQDIAMTAPVAQDSVAPGRWRIRFFMPSRYTLAALPKPNDPAVVLVEVPSQQVAVLRFSGDRSAAAVTARQRLLLDSLATLAVAPRRHAVGVVLRSALDAALAAPQRGLRAVHRAAALIRRYLPARIHALMRSTVAASTPL